MPRREWPIGRDGPIIDVRLWIGPEHEEALVARRLRAPAAISVAGLVDTGAQRSAIPRALAEGLGLTVHDWVRIASSALGAEHREAPVYTLRMTFGPLEASDAPRWRIVDAVGVTVVSPGAIVLIGQDLLATCRFTYDGRRSRLLMSY